MSSCANLEVLSGITLSLCIRLGRASVFLRTLHLLSSLVAPAGGFSGPHPAGRSQGSELRAAGPAHMDLVERGIQHASRLPAGSLETTHRNPSVGFLTLQPGVRGWVFSGFQNFLGETGVWPRWRTSGLQHLRCHPGLRQHLQGRTVPPYVSRAQQVTSEPGQLTTRATSSRACWIEQRQNPALPISEEHELVRASVRSSTHGPFTNSPVC